jgi:cbb3-type cytochrome oxidase cytochrome c subunit/predicted  nucleic acid-binding Zn-ribbon protein
LAPPKTPPDKKPDRHYNFGRMNMWFAVSSLGLLAVTLWMAFADYAQPWKRFQSEFRSLERQKLLSEAEAERQKISESDIAQLNKEIEAEEAKLASNRDEIEKLEERIRELNTEIYTADAAWRAAKAQVDAYRFEYDTALQHGGEHGADDKRKNLDEGRKRLGEEKARVEKATTERDAIQAQLAERRATVTAAEEKLKALNEGVENLQTRIASLNKDVDYFVLNAPLMDFVQPSLKVEQVILPGLYHNINFTNIDRVDRCMTCHVAANRPGFDGEEWKEPFRSHPNLDLYVGDGSPHPYTRYGCTICHGGLDRATDFARAGHSPTSAEQQREWERKYNWKKQQYLETPILPAGNAEAGCATCHAGGVWTAKAETQDVGRELVTHMGCYGCHTINYPAYTGLRRAGPALTRIAGKTNPGWAYKWIEAPREFHPTTFMPHFFHQENTKLPVNRKRQDVEMAAIVSFLWAKSEKPVYDNAAVPAGDPARGKALFESVGCAGCHINDAKAKRDDFFPVINRLHGPNLVRTGSKVSRGWLYNWLKNPKQYYPDTNMPNLRLTDQEAADLTAWLLSSRDPRFENVRLPAVDKTERDNLVLSYLQNLNTVERSKAKLAAMSDQERNVYLGEQTVAKYGCYGCHDIAGFENTKPIGTELTQEGSKPVHQFDFGHVHDVAHTRHDWIYNKVRRPRMWDKDKEAVKDYNELLKMPDFGASEREAKAVLTNVLGFTRESAIATRRAGNDPANAALAEGRRLITRFNCQGCHLIEEHGHAIKTMIKDVAMLPPNLAAEGARVQADWLWAYLHDPSRVEMRPWLTVRMPTFGFSDSQANTLISYFTARERRQPFVSQPGQADPRSLAVGGVVFAMLQCAKCHPAGAQAAAATGVSADLAPSLLLAHDRLRHDWVPDWIKDPQKWVPGTRMPSNFPEAKPGEFMSPVAQAINSASFAAQKQQMMRYFSSEAELNAYLSDVDKVTQALRDHIWSISGGGRAAPPPAPTVQAPTGGAVTAGAAGR